VEDQAAARCPGDPRAPRVISAPTDLLVIGWVVLVATLAAALAQDLLLTGGLVTQVDVGPPRSGFTLPIEQQVHWVVGGFMRRELLDGVGAQMEVGLAPVQTVVYLDSAEVLMLQREAHVQADVVIRGALRVGARLGAGMYVGDVVLLGEGVETGLGGQALMQAGLVAVWAPSRRAWRLRLMALKSPGSDEPRLGVGGCWTL